MIDFMVVLKNTEEAQPDRVYIGNSRHEAWWNAVEDHIKMAGYDEHDDKFEIRVEAAADLLNWWTIEFFSAVRWNDEDEGSVFKEPDLPMSEMEPWGFHAIY